MKAAIMGYGTIGSGVYEVLDKNCKSVEKKAGEPIEVKYILDLREFPGSPVEKLVIHDVEQIVNDPEIGIYFTSIGSPAFFSTLLQFLSRTSYTPEPMVPYPIIAAFICLFLHS